MAYSSQSKASNALEAEHTASLDGNGSRTLSRVPANDRYGNRVILS